LLAVLLVLLAAEGLARVLITLKRQYFDIGIDCTNPYADICPYAKDWDIEYGEAMRPSVIFGAAHVPGYQGEWTTINSLGFRGREFDPERPDGDLRIVVLGGSAALGAGVRDDETIPAYLDVEIEDQLACPVEVINGAVAGHMSAQELLEFEFKLLLPLNPDVVIIFDGGNDALFAILPDWQPNYSPSLQQLDAVLQGERPENPFKRTWRWLVSQSTLASIIDQIVIGAADVWGDQFRRERSLWTMNHEAIDVYKSNLQMMAQIAEANDVRLVLVLQPIMGAGNKPLSDAEQAILEVLLYTCL
jgi:lysophospholipase L1-like esterase